MSALPPPGCWDCGALPSAEDRSLRAVLVPRGAREGGPLTLLTCGRCGDRGALEDLPDGSSLLAPLEAVGAEPSTPAFLRRGEEAARRRRARAWADRWSEAMAQLREWRFRRSSAGPTIPPPPRARKTASPPPVGEPRPRKPRATPPPPPPPPPTPPPPPPAPPAEAVALTPDEARAVLEVEATADARAVDAAFRRLSRKCHPDLVAHLDADFQALAHRKFLRLKAAHDLLRGTSRRHR